MDEIRRLEMRRKASRRAERCECGRNVFGNGRVAHYRACKAYLRVHGWPFNDADSAVLRQYARESVAHIENSTERADAFIRFIREARLAEAKNRGLIP